MLSSGDSHLRDEIAAFAARLIAEDGLDYAGAKERAVREIVGAAGRRVDCMPDNARVVEAVREHQALFMRDTQPARLARLRTVARDVMRFLIDAGLGLEPLVVGAIVNGTAGDHSDVHLQLFDDSAKDLEIFLLNAGIEFEAVEAVGTRNGETLSFLWPQRRAAPSPHGISVRPEAVHLTICDPRDRRHAAGLDRADLAALERLIAADNA